MLDRAETTSFHHARGMLMKRHTLVLTKALLFTATLAACSSEPSTGNDGTGGAGGQTPTAGPTFHKDIEPILQKSCQSCHAPGQIAPFGLISYDDAKAVAGLMAMRTRDRTMPPWGAMETADCKPRYGWRDDARLSEEEIDLFEAWSAAGAPEGDPKDAPPPIDLAPAGLSGVELTVEPSKPYVTSGDQDELRCFVLDPKLTEDRYINGTFVIAGNAKVVHHALVFLDEASESVGKADADGGYDCFGGPKLTKAQLLAAWAPGGVPNEYPPNIGMKVPAGSKLVMQVHYHPAGTTADPDSTKFQMRFTKASPDYEARIALIGNFKAQQPNGDGLLPGPNDMGGVQFLIPAGAKDHTEQMRFTLPAQLPSLKVYGAGTHMHYVGTGMRITVNRQSPQNGEPADECLVETPKWDFNWQRSFDYDAAIDALPTVKGGDVLDFRCVYDNSLDNPFLKRALLEQGVSSPVDVKLGESTLDEMCLGVLNLIFPNVSP